MTHLRPTLIRGLLAALAALAWPNAGATAVAGPGGTAEQGRRIVFAAPAVANGAALELISAVIDEVQSERGQIVVHGKPVALHPTRLAVLRNGQNVGVAALQRGQSVRFALDAEPAGSRRIVLIHIDR